MFYQNILKDISPYQVGITNLGGFDEHRHADIEIQYCITGSFRVTIEKKDYLVNAGDLLIVSPMVSHKYPVSHDKERKILSIIVGVSFLKKYFTQFSNQAFISPVFKLEPENDTHEKLVDLLAETALICETKPCRNELLIQGNLYKICAYLLDITSSRSYDDKKDHLNLRKVANIDKALDLIYYSSASPLTVDDAAMVSGYAKSNFCKIFKSIVGDTFHNVLNKQRIENACGLLSQTSLPISEIAIQVGFEASKTFCRVFKTIMNVTPGTYRKEINKNRI